MQGCSVCFFLLLNKLCLPVSVKPDRTDTALKDTAVLQQCYRFDGNSQLCGQEVLVVSPLRGGSQSEFTPLSKDKHYK